MRPYYEADGITIYHGDCRELQSGLDVDLLVTDPPYGVNWQSGRRGEAHALIVGDADGGTALAGITAALRALKNHGHCYLFGRYDLSDLPLGRPVELIWDKGVSTLGDLSLPWASQHEYIQFAVHVPKASGRSAGDGGLTARLRRGSILRFGRVTSVRHPTEKPVDLLRELIESSSRIGEVVLDPFMGVGSTVVAARIEGRKAIGVEIEERYCEMTARRLDQGVLNLGVA